MNKSCEVVAFKILNCCEKGYLDLADKVRKLRESEIRGLRVGLGSRESLKGSFI